jgi:hypothetical protein
MNDPAQIICNSIGCSIEEATKAYEQTKDVTEAIDLLFVKPPCSSDKYLITKPKIISEEQEEFIKLRVAMEKIDNEITCLSQRAPYGEGEKQALLEEMAQQSNCFQICQLPSPEVGVEIPETACLLQSGSTCGSQ